GFPAGPGGRGPAPPGARAGGGARARPAAPAAGGAAPASSAPAAVQPLSPMVSVEIGAPMIIADTGVYIAIERGYFREEGLDVDIANIQGGDQLLVAMTTKDVQFGSSALDAAMLNAIARGINVKILQDKSRFRAGNGTAALLARQDLYDTGVLRELPQIRGKNIAVLRRNATPEYYLEIAFKRIGLTLDDMAWSTMLPTDTPVAFANKAVEAGWVYEPLITGMEMQGMGRVLVDAGEIVPDEYPQLLYSPESYIQENPEVVRRFVTAHLRGQRDYYRAFVTNEADRGEIVQFMTKYTAVKDPAFYERMRFHAVEPNGYVDPAPLQRFMEFCLDNAVSTTRLDMKTLIDARFIDYAVERLGRWPDPYR